MKQILTVIFSISIFSSAIIGENKKTETLYGWGYSYPYDWKDIGNQKLHAKYEGNIKNGVPDGQGVLTSTNGWMYFGSWKNGEIWNGTEYDNFGNIIYIWLEGKRKYDNRNIKFR